VTETSRYLLLLPGPEAEWEALPDSEKELGMANHQRFHEQLAARGHRVVTAGPLEPSAQAISMRNTSRGTAQVTQGPFAETAEQIVGFYLLETEDSADLVDVVRAFAEGGDHVELRRLASG
jgi:hypothetical protein